MGVIKLGVVVLVAGLGACGSEKVDQCDKDSDCTNIAYPFCDVSGQYAPSGGETHVCTVTPADCPIDRCGCSPGATSCTGDQETTCNVDGKSTTTTTCSLGCADSKDHCLAFDPSNNLGPPMTAAANEGDVVFPMSVTINTDTGIVLDSGNVAVNVTSLVVAPQDIRVFIAKSFMISNATITGTKPVAFVAPGAIVVSGVVAANSASTTGGPGALAAGNCVGAAVTTSGDVIGGGGGNATAGGRGNGFSAGTVAGGTSVGAEFDPLIGGCSGGGVVGGGGGGGIQFDSFTSIAIATTGFVDVGGAGGQGAKAGGGGAGGTVVFEAPSLNIAGGVAGNGGSGGACGQNGTNGSRSSVAASGPACGTGINTVQAGAGATATVAPGDGAIGAQGGDAGGGGAVGRMRISTLDGTYMRGSNALTSIVVTTATLFLK